jgi:hypothetical protein
MKKTVKIYRSFSEQDADDVSYWRNLPGDEKLNCLEIIRAQYWAMNNEAPPRFQRIYKVIKRPTR